MAGVDEGRACPACGQDTEVVITDGDLRIRVDPGHHPDGTVHVRELTDGRVRARILTGSELPATEPARRDHRRTCPRSSHAVRRNDAAAVKCGVCRTRMDPWLAENGYHAHINCLPARRTA